MWAGGGTSNLSRDGTRASRRAPRGNHHTGRAWRRGDSGTVVPQPAAACSIYLYFDRAQRERERERERDWSSDLNQLPGRAAAAAGARVTIIQWPGSLISPVTSSSAATVQQQPLLTVAAAKNPIYCSDFDRKCTDNNQPEIQFIALAGAGRGQGAALHDCCCHSAHNYTTSTLVRLYAGNDAIS